MTVLSTSRPLFMMCPPTHFDIAYEINPWMSIKRQANKEGAGKQWEQLCQAMLDAGAEIKLVEPQPGLPDMVFTANAALYKDGKVFLARFRHPERQGEHPGFLEFFKEHGFEVAEEAEEFLQDGEYRGPSFEGAGDALYLGEKLFCAYGFRSDQEFYEKLGRTFPYFEEQIVVELVDPRFYHLDTCFCPLDSSTALCFLPAFSPSSQEKIRKAVPNLIEVEESEAEKFACNSVIVNTTVVMPAGCPGTQEKVEKFGFSVVQVPMTEFLKSGGACKCLTLNITKPTPQ